MKNVNIAELKNKLSAYLDQSEYIRYLTLIRCESLVQPRRIHFSIKGRGQRPHPC